MKTISLDKVVIPENRIRKVFDQEAIEELAESILRIGLIHLPVLRDGYELVAGERRFRAMKYLHEQNHFIKYLGTSIPTGFIPYASFEDLSDLDAYEIELHENARRVDLPWQTVAEATAKLHALRKAADPNWHHIDTAVELGFPSPGTQQTKVAERIVLSENMHRPEVRSAKTETEAKKVLKKSMEREFKAELRLRQPAKKTKHVLIHGKAEEYLASWGKPEIDVIISDPPYGINAGNFGVPRTSNKPGHKYEDSAETSYAAYSLLSNMGFRITKSKAHIYLFCDFSFTAALLDLLRDSGWDPWPRPIIWYKHSGNLPKPDLGPKYVHEYIIYANKGKRPTTGLYPDVIDCPAVVGKNYAAEKPVEVYKNLLMRSVNPGNKVLDPFCGSGPIFPAAHALGCIATGIDVDEEAIALSKERLNKLG